MKQVKCTSDPRYSTFNVISTPSFTAENTKQEPQQHM